MNTQMGSQVDQGQLRKIMSYVELAKEEGATIACGGEPYKEGACANGAFMKPTLIVNANNNMRVAQEEIFGPVAVVIKFKTEEEVIAMANDSVYGLGGAVDPGHQPCPAGGPRRGDRPYVGEHLQHDPCRRPLRRLQAVRHRP